MYRADLVRARQPFYALGRLHEDTEVVFELLKLADFGFVPQVLTFTREQDGSLSHSARAKLTQALDELINASTFGPYFLEPEELASCLRRHHNAYYRALARRRIKYFGRRDAEFWDYQRRGLATIGQEIDKSAMWRETLPGLIERLRPMPLSGD
jgi:hypothetical protein